jgi:hypothetical protein
MAMSRAIDAINGPRPAIQDWRQDRVTHLAVEKPGMID